MSSKTWKQTAAERRDNRASKTDVNHSLPAKKDTKSWCKGKEGVEHIPKAFALDLTYERRFKKSSGVQLCCSACGKVLETYWGFGTQNIPEWAKEYISLHKHIGFGR